MNTKLNNLLKEFVSSTIPEKRFFGEFMLWFNFKEMSSCPTVGVMSKNGTITCVYNNDFVEKLKNESLAFVMLHECEHVLRSHISRTITGGFKHKKSNIAQDMIINSIIKESYDNLKWIKPPTKDEIVPYYIPKDYDGIKAFEPLYDFLEDQYSNGDGSGDRKSVV